MLDECPVSQIAGVRFGWGLECLLRANPDIACETATLVASIPRIVHHAILSRAASPVCLRGIAGLTYEKNSGA